MTAARLKQAARERSAVAMVEAAAEYARLKAAGTITEQPNPADRRQRITTDSRTTRDADGVPVVLPFYVGAASVLIVCPYCGELHTHGNGASGYAGHRAAHCMTAASAAGYTIAQAQPGEDQSGSR